MSDAIGTAGFPNATRLLLLGSGELGKEVAIEAQRYGIEVIAADRYAGAPAMQVAQHHAVLNMLDPVELQALIERVRPTLIVPELEAIHTATLLKAEAQGVRVIPTARAAHLTMDREGIRRLAAETLGLATSAFRFADTVEDYRLAVAEIGLPCVVKPLMSSSGKGQSTVRSAEQVQTAWDYAQQGGRAGAGRVIVEAFVPFDFEITLLTVRHVDGTEFCEPIGHYQEDGDYRESWQPQPMSATALARAQQIARCITENLGGYGVFGVELFVRGDEVLFSEVSPRPHDTGLVTLVSQELSQFALHVRAILGLPIPVIRQLGASASCAVLASGIGRAPRVFGAAAALREPDTQLRLFGKPQIDGQRRMGVTLARGSDLFAAREKARRASAQLRFELDEPQGQTERVSQLIL
jgi:phosphoribosylglycinamide formyltransferase 2